MKPNRSLLIITEDSPDSYSPAGERVRHIALASKSMFKRVLILTLHGTRKPKKTGLGNISNVSLYALNFKRAMPFPISNFFDPVKFLMVLCFGFIFSRRLKLSHIVVSMPPLETGLSAWLLARQFQARFVVDLRDDWESAVGAQLTRYIPARLVKLLSKLSDRVYSSSACVFAVTQTIADTVKKRGIKTQTLLVPNGADTSLFTPRNKEARRRIRMKHCLPVDKLVFVYCGSGINPYYRLDLLLASARSLPEGIKDRIFLVFYVYNGSGHLRKMQNLLGILKNQVEIRDPLPRRRLAEVLSVCDVGLVPFDSRAYLLCARSTKLYEYLSTGLYVIASGPRAAELDSFFSENSYLGMFTQPSVEGYVQAFRQFVQNTCGLFNERFRAMRHSFIRKNYDRQTVMKKAMKTLFSDTSTN